MLFNSLTYLLYMAIVVPPVIFGPAWLRRAIFVIGSILFYAFWRIDFTALILFSAGTDYVAGKYIARTDRKSVRRLWLAASLTVNFAILGFFKYAYFINDSVASLMNLVGIDRMPRSLQAWLGAEKPLGITSIILPLGVSFYTFESVSYVIDVYRRVQSPLPTYWTFMNFVLFWPKLVAGPILRTSEVIPQVLDYQRPSRGQFLYGLEEILQGLFKKVVLADTLSEWVDLGFRTPVDQLGALDVWVLAFGFGLQIYFDFSGYSSIALGSARLMGFHFPRNFNWPYLAVSARDFWKRWHISLSSWIQDYLYIPLQGVEFRKRSERGKGIDTSGEREAGSGRRTAALFATWFIMGLWHGANWTFAAWGVWHAILIFVYRAAEPLRSRLPGSVRVIGGWAFTVPTAMLGWIYFRADSLSVANQMIFAAFDPTRLFRRSLRENTYLFVAVFFIGFLAIAGLTQLPKSRRIPEWIQLTALTVANAFMLFWVFLMLRDVQAFIYFQF